jgi:NitT/TauT family transport system substrate-binding protein
MKARTLTKRTLAVLVSIGVIGTLSSCGNSDEGDSSTIAVMLPFQDSIIFPGYEIARGEIYDSLGFEVETQAVSGTAPVIQLLAAGKMPFAISGAADLIIAASQGHDLVSIANINSDMFTIRVPEDSPIDAVEDLQGKKLGIVDVGDGAMPMVRAAIADAGLEVDKDVELVVVGDGGPASSAALRDGKIDAYAGAVNDMVAMETTGLIMRSILDERYRGLPNNVLVVTRKTLEDPKALEDAIDVAAGWFLGSLAADADPEASLEVICGFVPADCEDREIAEAFFDQALGLELDQAKRAGEHDLVKFELIRDAIVADQIEGEPSDTNLDALFSNDYVDEIRAVMDAE